MNKYGNLSLADRYAALKAEIDGLTKLLDAAKAEIKATGQDIVEGHFADVVVSLSERTCFNSTKAKLYLTAEQIAACTSTSLIETVRIKVKAIG